MIVTISPTSPHDSAGPPTWSAPGCGFLRPPIPTLRSGPRLLQRRSPAFNGKQFPSSYLKTIVSFVFLLALTGCQTIRNAPNKERPGGLRDAQEKKESAWIKQQGLVRASPEEIAVASAGEVRFVGAKATIPGHSLSVVFGAIPSDTGSGLN